MILEKRTIALIVIATFGIGGCADMNYSKEQIGGVGGSVAGALIGYNLIGGGNGRYLGAALGGLAGYLAGKTIGKHMDDQDRERLVSATDTGLRREPGRTYEESWKNGDRTYETRITPQDSYARGNAQCKHFTQETVVMVDSKREIAQQQGTACYDRTQNLWIVQR